MSISLEDLKASYNWENVFNYACETNNKHKNYSRDDVASIITTVEGCNDGDNWVGLFIMNDGKYLYLTAWCDYTGWGCRESGDSRVYDSLAEAVNFGCTEEDRERLDLKLM